MPKFTAFLNLTLPELNEFVDSWNEPLNQNFEDLDDWLSELSDNLVGTGSGSTWSSLRGSLANLSDRLAVSIQPDGSIDVSGSSDILDMATSATRGSFSNPRDRLNDMDREIYEARQPVADGRFVAMAPGGPSAGFPYEELDAGIALRSADFGRTAAEPISSPQRPWAPGLINGGGSPLITSGGGTNRALLDGTTPAVFNIDGYIFRIREQILFDFASIPGLAPSDYVWLYVSRNETSYNNAIFKYSEAGGTPVAKDLRKLKTGADGVTSGSTFTSASGTWNTAPFTIKEGDVLVVETGAAAGEYVIDALDGTTPNIKLTIKGAFKAAGAGLTYHIYDRFMPNIGAAIASTNPNLATSRPPSADGRVYIGRVQAGAPITSLITFTKGGVYDSGWVVLPAAVSFIPQTFAHNLGAIPSSVEVWVRLDNLSRAYRPLVRRDVLTHFDDGNATVEPTDAKKTTLLMPSMYEHCSEVDVTVDLLSDSPDSDPTPQPSAYFTDSGGTDQTSGEIRVIARR
jgi:hypothetical protein